MPCVTIIEGTALDISNDFGAGPYKTPYRLSPLTFKVGDKEYFNERPISTQQSGFVFVAQMRANLPDAVGGVLSFGTDDANMTVSLPYIAVLPNLRYAIPVWMVPITSLSHGILLLDFQLGG